MLCLGRLKRLCGHFMRCRHWGSLCVPANRKAGRHLAQSPCKGAATATLPVRLPRRVVRGVVTLVVLLVLVLVLHYRVLPASMGYYNQDCAMTHERRERMRHVLREVVRCLNEENATYWLDYGTLLGVVREGDIMRHDGDMDLSRLADDLTKDRELMDRVGARLQKQGMSVTPLVVKYQDVTVDMFRWQTVNSSQGQALLRKYYPFVPKVGWAERLSDWLFPPDVAPGVVFPLRQLSVLGVPANIPRRTLDFLRARYPLTWTLTFPYKWKCWTGG